MNQAQKIGLIIGLVVFLIIIIFIVIYMETKTPASMAMTPAAPGVYTSNPGTIGSTIGCLNNSNALPGTNTINNCIVPKDLAVSTCNSVPGCSGYSTTTNAAWNTAYANGAQLVSNSPLVANSEWNSYMKNAPT